MRLVAAVFALGIICGGTAHAAEPSPLAQARMLYNAADYDGAIAAAVIARTQPATADAAALVEARAHLERYRHGGDGMDLTAAREALTSVHAAALSPRDQVDLLVGLGQSLYYTDMFGAAAELFDTALDREAQGAPPDRRARLAEQIADRMEEELRRDPGSAPANYWRAVAARTAGDVDAAWDAAVAAWVRAALSPAAPQLRSDIDRLVTDAIIPERARHSDQPEAVEAMRSEWNQIKEQWK